MKEILSLMTQNYFLKQIVKKVLNFYLSSDTESLKIYNLLKEKTNLRFKFIDLNVSCGETFGNY